MSLRLKLILAFLVVAVTPALLIAVLTFENYERAWKSDRTTDLETIAAYKADKIDTYFSGLKADLEVVQSLYNIKKNFPVLNQYANAKDNPEFVSSKQLLDRQLQQVQRVFNLADILLVNPQGKILYSSNPDHFAEKFLKPLPDPGAKAFSEGMKRIYFSDIFRGQGKAGRLSMLVTAPAIDMNNNFIGVIAFDVDMGPIYSLIQDVTGLGGTGETLIGRKIGNRVIFLNPLRHDPAAALRREVPIGEKSAQPIQLGSLGQQGSGLRVDYRGKQVIAAWRFIPSLGWGLVAKIDKDEAFAEIAKLRKTAMVIFICIFGVIILLVMVITKAILDPLKRLSTGTEIIGNGNLDYRVGIQSRDEIGQLSRAFDAMTQNLKKSLASRDELNREMIERKRAETELRIRDEELKEQFNELIQIYKHTPVGLFVVDRHFRFLRVNEHLAEINGKPMEAHLGHLLTDVVPRSLADEFMRIWQRVIEKGESFLNCEIAGETAKMPGMKRYWLLNAFPYKSSSGNIVGVAGAIMEISDRKFSEEILRQTRDYLEKLFNYANAPIMCWDRDFKITRFNHAFEHLSGYKAEEVIGKDLGLLFPEESKDDSFIKIRRVLSGEQWDSVEIPILRKDWEIRTVLWNSANIYAEDAKTFLATIAQGQDITARKIAEEALLKSRDELELRVNQRTLELRQANELMERIFSTTHFSIVYLDPQFNFIRVNKAYAKSCGYPPEFFIGKNHFDLYPNAENQEIFENVVKTGQPFSIFAKPFVFSDHPEWGITYWDWSLLPVKNELGKVEALLFCLVDVTKRELAEQELKKTQDQLTEAKRLSDIGTLAATVAHELRNPLAAIHMAAFNMHRKAKSPLLDHHLEVIERKINESDQIINNLLFYSRIKPPKREPTDIHAVVEECLTLAQDRFAKGNVTILKKVERLKTALTDADPLQLKEVFSNIMNNAFDAMRDRGGKISVTGEVQGDLIHVQISDEGPGIGDEDLKKVFDPFFTTKAQGTGLGLTVCRQIVSLHGGEIGILSQKGLGTTVSVKLPAKRADHE